MTHHRSFAVVFYFYFFKNVFLINTCIDYNISSITLVEESDDLALNGGEASHPTANKVSLTVCNNATDIPRVQWGNGWLVEHLVGTKPSY